MNHGIAMTGTYTVTCPYCRTRIQGTARQGVFESVSSAAKALNGHLLYHCAEAPTDMRPHQRETVVAGAVRSVGE